jgi:hypothetical protein
MTTTNDFNSLSVGVRHVLHAVAVLPSIEELETGYLDICEVEAR